MRDVAVPSDRKVIAPSSFGCRISGIGRSVAPVRDLEAIRNDPHEREYHPMLEAAVADITEWEY